MTQLTDKEIYEASCETSLGCPNCGGRLALAVDDRLTSEGNLRIAQELHFHRVFSLVSVENAAANAVKNRDRGGFTNEETDRVRKLMAQRRGE